MKEKKYSGFTLIELLAVIVILAIIALIATPIILGIVEDARKDSFMRSVELVVGTTDIDIFGKDFTDSYTYTITDGVVSNLEVGVKNTEGMNGKIKYDKNGNDTYAIHNGKYCVIKTKGMKKAEITDYVEGECELGKATNSKYFTYEEISEIEYEYEIADVDTCLDYYEGANNVISLCNNEPHDWWDGLTLTEYLASSDEDARYEMSALKQAGVIEEIIISLEGIEITGYSSEGPKDVIIPQEINGKQVISIGSFAFSDKSLTSVELPETLVRIRHSAFSTNLFTDITLPSSLEIVEDYAFCYTNLNQTSINNIEEINENAHCTMTDENCFTYEDAVVTVEYEIDDVDACVEYFTDIYHQSSATRVCNNEEFFDEMPLTEALLGYPHYSITEQLIEDLIDIGAIEEKTVSLDGIKITGYKCAATDVVIPEEIDGKEVVAIGKNAFEFPGYNSSYIKNDSITLISNDFATISGTSGPLRIVAMPDSVSYIEGTAFNSNRMFSLKLSSNLLNIANYVFYENNELSDLYLPNSLTTIGMNAFEGTSIRNIIISNNNSLENIDKYAFSCLLGVPEDSKAYQIINNINNQAFTCGAPG